MASREYRFYTYILGSLSGTLYIGMAKDLERRVWQHKHHEFAGFTAKYGVDRLLYFESVDDVRNAIDREKQLKGGKREKKIALIEAQNPEWLDLSRKWYEHDSGPSTPEALRASSAQDDKEQRCRNGNNAK
jgi:putative endonuclease